MLILFEKKKTLLPDYFVLTRSCGFFSMLLGFVARIFASRFPAGAYQEVRRMCQRTRQRRLLLYPKPSQESQAQKWRKQDRKAAVF